MSGPISTAGTVTMPNWDDAELERADAGAQRIGTTIGRIDVLSRFLPIRRMMAA